MVHMDNRPRLYAALLRDPLRRNRQMALVSGPRQVGKTTVCRAEGDRYLDWDNTDDRRVLLRGPSALAQRLDLDRLRVSEPVAVLDLPYAAADCFAAARPQVVPARTLLSQLL